jgi:uncharacterized protein YndB with AHSA1/START domain
MRWTSGCEHVRIGPTMAEAQPIGEAGEYGIAITRVFDAPRERVWREWTQPDCFSDWFGGAQADVPPDSVAMDVRAGGAWRLTMRFGASVIHWKGEFVEVRPPERLVFTVTDRPDDERREIVTVELAELGDGRTEMRFEQRGHMRPEDYERTGAGWGTFFERIDERLREA